MAIHVEHELHNRRWGRNFGLGLVLIAFVALIFGLTVVKVTGQGEGALQDAMREAGAMPAVEAKQ